MDCIFCKIVAKQIYTDPIYEDDDVIAFNDINPKSPIHFLVIPKKHIENVEKLEEGDYPLVAHIFKVIKIITKKLNISDKGYKVITNCGKNAGQEVFHLHFHVLA